MKPQPINITHVITALPRGGAQTILGQLVQRADRHRFAMDVVSLADIGPVGERLRAEGVRVRALGMNPRLPNPVAPLRLARWLRRDRTHLVQTWLYHGDLVGGLAARLAGVPVIWNLRQTDLDPAHTGAATRLTMRACAALSRSLPRRIVCCSEASARVHAAVGYDAGRMNVIANGVDLARFQPLARAGADVRSELGIASDAALIGLFARHHPQKDHASFFAAVGRIAPKFPDAHFLLCGEGVEGSNAEVAALRVGTGVPERIHLLGIRDDVPRLAAALDLAVSSSSFGEGFSNVVVEAMACGVACVATDVGEAALIVGDTGWIVSPRDSGALAAAMSAALSDRQALRARGSQARQRVEQEYSITTMVGRYESLYEEAAQGALRTAQG